MSDDQGSILDRIISTQQASHREQFAPQQALHRILETLPERERQILWRRYGLGGQAPETLESIGRSLQVTRERVRQIERLAIDKLRRGTAAHEALQPVRQVVVELLESDGGAATEERVLRLITETGGTVSPNVVRFYLDEALAEVVAPIGAEGESFVAGWRLRSVSLEALTAIIDRAHDAIEQRAAPIPEEELARTLVAAKLASPLGGVLADGRVALALTELSASVKRNAFGEWGLAHWDTITPKRMNDKIYLVLKKHGKPLHFREITNLINEAKFDRKVAYPPTVHNELIMDKKYVLVGRGIYALVEWGYAPGVVADVLTSILKQRGAPMTRDELVGEVLRQRVVKRGTVHLALTNRKRFARTTDGRYTLATVVV